MDVWYLVGRQKPRLLHAGLAYGLVAEAPCYFSAGAVANADAEEPKPTG